MGSLTITPDNCKIQYVFRMLIDVVISRYYESNLSVVAGVDATSSGLYFKIVSLAYEIKPRLLPDLEV